MSAGARTLLSPLLRAVKPSLNNMSAARMATKTDYKTLAVSVPKPFVYHVELNRPEALNALSRTLWVEIEECFKEIHQDPDCRVVVLSGSGRMFTAGLDFKDAMKYMAPFAEIEDPARKAKAFRSTIQLYQQSMSSLEAGNKPVIAAIHSGCIGAGTSIISSADIRYCTKDAWFQVKEVILGMAADVGVLQRLPKIIKSDSLCRELCYTARKMDSEEAYRCGLVSKLFEDKESMIKGALELAEDIAKNSPVAVQGTKHSLVYSRDHSVQEGLDHICNWNQCMLQSEDFINGVMALATKQSNVTFSKL